MVDRLKPGTKQWRDRQRRWQHNGHSGSVRMMQAQLMAIERSSSTSVEAKCIARTMLNCIGPLQEALKERIDLP